MPVLRKMSVLLLAAALLPPAVEAQTATFENLQAELAVNQTLIVTDDGGRVIKGRLLELSNSSLTVRAPTTPSTPTR
jgi:hypothetical protein